MRYCERVEPIMRCCDLQGVARFADRAADYAAARPSYPVAAIDFILDGQGGPGALILDVGAGTGISTRLLERSGGRVVAVEPSLPMLQAASAARPVAARAETLPFPDARADLVTVFNAFHWFQGAQFLGEAHRILRPRGKLALAWNDWDFGDAFTGAFAALMRTEAPGFPPEDREGEVAPLYESRLFPDVERRSFPNEQRLDGEHLRLRMRSISYIPKTGPRWERLVRELDVLFDAYADASGQVTHRYSTSVFVARREEG